MSLKSTLLLISLLAIYNCAERIQNQEWRKKFMGWKEDDADRHKICNELLWPNGEEDLYTTLYKVERLDESDRAKWPEYKINWFDMTYDNMAAVINAAWKSSDPTDTTKWFEKEYLTPWTMAQKARYWNQIQPKEDNVEGFYFWGQYLSSGNTSRGGHVNKVIWLIEKRDGTEILGEPGENSEDTMRITGKIYQLLCMGRYKDGVPLYKASRSEYVIYEPVFDFQMNTDVDIPQFYFHGLNCPLIPNRPVFSEPGAPCVWAIRIGKYFNSGAIENTVNGEPDENYRECIQKIMGRRTHTLQCFYSSIDSDNWATVEELQAGEYSTQYTDKQVALISKNIDLFENSQCIGFKKKIDKDNHYQCLCSADRTEYPDDSSKDWEWDPKEHTWLKKPYHCQDFIQEKAGCLRRDENDYDACKVCKPEFVLAEYGKHDCVPIESVKDLKIPIGCWSGKMEKGDFKCVVCSELYSPNTRGECIFVNDNDSRFNIPHCEHHDINLFRCLQCEVGYSVKRNLTGTKQDVCMHFDNKEFGKGYNGCGHLVPSTADTDIPECEWCKFGWHQMNPYNSGCFFKNFAELTEHQKLVLATRSDRVSNGIDEILEAENAVGEEAAKLQKIKDEQGDKDKQELMLEIHKKRDPCFTEYHQNCHPDDFQLIGMRIFMNSTDKTNMKKVECSCTKCHFEKNSAAVANSDPKPYKNCILRKDLVMPSNEERYTHDIGDKHVCYNSLDLIKNKNLAICEPKDFVNKDVNITDEAKKICICNKCMNKFNWVYDCKDLAKPVNYVWPFTEKLLTFDEKYDLTPKSEVDYETILDGLTVKAAASDKAESASLAL